MTRGSTPPEEVPRETGSWIADYPHKIAQNCDFQPARRGSPASESEMNQSVGQAWPVA
jgi:hypothetical protein